MKWSGKTSAYEHKHKFPADLDPKTPEGLRKVWFLDAQWSRCPIEVEQQVKDLWRHCELGNDNYVLKTTLDELKSDYVGVTVERWNNKKSECETIPLKTDLIVQYIGEMAPDIGDDELIVIHWWW